MSGARQRSGGVEKYSSIASRQAPEHGSAASSRLEDRHVFLSAFDLLELNGQDLRRKIKERKRLLPKLIPNAKPGLREDIAEAGDLVFRYACELGLSGEPFMGRIPARDRDRGPVVLCAIVPIAVCPKGGREAAVRLIRAKSGQTFAESPGEAYLAARLLAWGLELYFFWGAGACVVLH